MKKVVLFILISFSTALCAQEIVVAAKEPLATISIGDNIDQIGYSSSEEGFYSPNGPMVDHKGRLLFFPTSGYFQYKALVVFEKGKGILSQDLFEVMRDWDGMTQVQFVSQQGLIQANNVFIDPKVIGARAAFFPQAVEKIPISKEVYYYPLPNGSYCESRKPPFVFSTEVEADRTIKVRDFGQTKIWLSDQPGSFSIGNDGLLYRNGVLWSAIAPIDVPPCKYLGRLASGHSIWASGQYGMERRFFIANSLSRVEMVLDLPWAYDYANTKDTQRRSFNYGLGPWGELYCLIAPIDWRKPSLDSSSELVAVRNHLKYFGRLNDTNIRLRKDPSTSAEILGTYPAKTGFRIIEKGTKQETIGGKTDYWYHVRLLDGKEGWFFGSFVANLYDGPGTPPPWPNVADW